MNGKKQKFSTAWKRYEKRCDPQKAPYYHFYAGFITAWKMCVCQTGGQSKDYSREIYKAYEGECRGILCLSIKKKWFDMIAIGKKTEEYRAYSPHWISRLVEEIEDNGNFIYKKFDYNELRNGYGLNVPRQLVSLVGINYGFGRTEWGAPKEKVFILKLGEIIWIKNWKGTV